MSYPTDVKEGLERRAAALRADAAHYRREAEDLIHRAREAQAEATGIEDAIAALCSTSPAP